MPAIKTLLIGAGNRGRSVFGRYALEHPERLRIIGVAEPVDERRAIFAREHDLPTARCYQNWPELLSGVSGADAVIVATGDSQHVEPAIAALASGHHVLLEKPIAPSPEACLRVVEAAETAQRALQIGHVLRHTDFYQRVHAILRSGRIGRIIHMDLREHVAHWHMAHSYVRGKFRNSQIAAPFILAKSCHDLDLLVWLAEAPVLKLQSFGSRSHYRQEYAPPGAPERCTDGCPVQASCPHDAEAFYLGPNEELARLWPWHDLSTDPSHAARRKALENGRYGRCAYRCDNDVADHQTVNLELEDGVTATLGVHGVATHESRTLRISGSEGELRGHLDSGAIEITRHGQLESEQVQVPEPASGHSGGDEGLMHHFTDALLTGELDEVCASGRTALESHLLGFAAEVSRAESRVVEMGEYRESIKLSSR